MQNRKDKDKEKEKEKEKKNGGTWKVIKITEHLEGVCCF
jgi:hypothetical protein